MPAHRPKKFTDAQISEALATIKANAPKLWEALIDHERAKEPVDDVSDGILNAARPLSLASNSLETVDLLWALRRAARAEVGLPV